MPLFDAVSCYCLKLLLLPMLLLLASNLVCCFIVFVFFSAVAAAAFLYEISQNQQILLGMSNWHCLQVNTTRFSKDDLMNEEIFSIVVVLLLSF